jgi:hypothetical protein
MSAFVRLWYRFKKRHLLSASKRMCGHARFCSRLLAFSELSFVFAIDGKRVVRFEVGKREHGRPAGDLVSPNPVKWLFAQ